MARIDTSFVDILNSCRYRMTVDCEIPNSVDKLRVTIYALSSTIGLSTAESSVDGPLDY